jgi:hypothetical protein
MNIGRQIVEKLGTGGTMNVGELIKILQSYPQDAKIEILTVTHDWKIVAIYTCKNGYDVAIDIDADTSNTT